MVKCYQDLEGTTTSLDSCSYAVLSEALSGQSIVYHSSIDRVLLTSGFIFTMVKIKPVALRCIRESARVQGHPTEYITVMCYQKSRQYSRTIGITGIPYGMVLIKVDNH